MQGLGLADVQAAGRVGAAQPFLPRDGVEVVPPRLDRDRAGRLGAVHEHGQSGRILDLLDGEHVAGLPGHVREGDQARPRCHLGQDRLQRALGRLCPHRGDSHDRLRSVERAQEAEVLRVRGDDLVLGSQAQPGEDDVAAFRRRRGQRDVLGRHADRCGQPGAHALAKLEHGVDVRLPTAAELEVGELLGRHRLDGRTRERAHRARIQIGDLVEDGELRAGFVEVHSSSSIGGWSDSSMPSTRRRSSGQT
jgi:hypothetical protein